jgi:acyl-CoA synthetase (AMP-forming)/AMP-acid ligase II
MKALTLPRLIDLQASRLPGKTAYTFVPDGDDLSTSVAWTYSELADMCRRAAAQITLSVPPGARIVLLFPAGLDFLAAFFGSMYARTVPVPLYPPEGMRSAVNLKHIASVIRNSAATTVLCDQAVMSFEPEFRRLAPDLTHVTWQPLAMDAAFRLEEDPPRESEDIAFLQYTSGSTGTPKGVVLTHKNLLANQGCIQSVMKGDEDTVMVSWLPLYHDMGLVGCVMQPLYLGGTCVLSSPARFIRRPLHWLNLISKVRGTISGGPNFAFDLCTARAESVPDDLDLTSWKVAFNGSEPVRTRSLEAFHKAFARYGLARHALFPCYGMAETSLIVSGADRDWRAIDADGKALALGKLEPAQGDAVATIVSCGEVAESMSVEIVDPETRVRQPDGTLGEIWVRGDSVARGYWNKDPSEFLSAIEGEECPPSWLRTGDLGFRTDRELFITGRMKDLIIVAGRKFLPEDLERTVRDTDERLQRGLCCVFALPDESIAVLNEVRGLEQSDYEALAVEIKKSISRVHGCSVDTVAFSPPRSIPRTLNGKIRRGGECRRLFVAGKLQLITVKKFQGSSEPVVGAS